MQALGTQRFPAALSRAAARCLAYLLTAMLKNSVTVLDEPLRVIVVLDACAVAMMTMLKVED
jgi:hypothetical protein